MRFLKIIHIYLLVGTLAGIFFSISRLGSTILPFFVYLGLTVNLAFLFFKHRQSLLFNNLLLLFVLQLISIKTATFGYLLGIGFGIFTSFAIDSHSAREVMISFSTADFSSAPAGQRQTVGINLFAVILLLLLILTKEK